MVLIATTSEGHSLAFKVATPVTDEELRRLVAIQRYVPDAEWTGREGDDVR